jgi:hypothetical protein
MNTNMDNMEDIVVLEWKFSPPDYFEEPIHIKRDDYVMTISNGTVEARIRPELYDKDQSIRDRLYSSLNDRFLGVQLFSHKPYELSKASMYRLHPDGRRDITIFADPIVVSTSIRGEADFMVKHKDGNVISDSRQERIQKKQKLAKLAEKYGQKNPFVASIMRSNNNAVKDPDNELVYLYEICDSIAKHFGGESVAKEQLGISRKWKRLKNLANNEPLKQGRHRGKNPGVLRDATEGELREARRLVCDLVEAYFDYLEGSKSDFR